MVQTKCKHDPPINAVTLHAVKGTDVVRSGSLFCSS
jgi:hypothetical protein